MRARPVPAQHKPYDVVGFGLNAVDHLCWVPTFPTFDSKMSLDRYECQPGGQVATALVALRRWGLRTAYLGAFGDDAFGVRSRAALEAEGVAVDGAVVRTGVPNQLAIILVDAQSGERTVLWHRDPALAVRPEELHRQRVCAGRVLHLDGTDRDAAVEAAGWARAAGIPTVIDLDRPGPRVEDLLARIDIAIVPGECAEELTGRGDATAALSVLANCGCELVGVTLGREGVVARYEGQTLHIPGFAVRAVDSTGAGDVFHAGIIHGLLNGLEVEAMLRFANAAAALQCTGFGAQPAIPALEAVYRLARG